MIADEVAALTPSDEAEASAMVAEARGRGETLDIVGGGSRAGLGRPPEGTRHLSSARLDGIVFHEPAEMVLRAKAGTPLAAVEAALEAHGQMLPFEPIDHRALYGGGEPTIGGLAATNASGPRRVSAGAARDSVIGLRLVNGRGEAIMTGGRVMKNVAGLDLVKLNCGALGTLGFLTEATFKLLPKPESEATIVVRRLDDARAIAAMTAALGSPFGVSGAATLSPGMGREFSRTFLRVEGVAASVDHRAEKLHRAARRIRRRARAEGRRFAPAVARRARRRIPRRAARARGLARRRQAVARPSNSSPGSDRARWRISSTAAAASSGSRPNRRRPTPPPCARRSRRSAATRRSCARRTLCAPRSTSSSRSRRRSWR